MKSLKYLIVTLILLLVGASYSYAHIVRLAFIDYSDFHVVNSNIYLSENLSPADEETVVSLLKSARERIAVRYGDPVADPVVVVLSSPEEKRDFGLYDVPGTLLFAPWGSYLLLSYQNGNIDVTAHELVHAEVVERVGYWKRQFDIPTWFDEGAAMQVDHRARYRLSDSIGLAEFDRVVGLDTPGQFWTGSKEQNIDNYRGAKGAVAELFDMTDTGLYSLLAKVKAGDHSVVTALAEKARERLVEQER